MSEYSAIVITVTEAAIEVIATLADALSNSRVATSQVLDECVWTDGTGIARSVVADRRIRQI